MAPGFLAPQRVVVATTGQVSTRSSSTGSSRRSTFLENYWRNPQYLIRLHQEHDTNSDQLCTMIIFLSIKKPHERHARRAEDDICFQCRVYKVSGSDEWRQRTCRLVRYSTRPMWMKVSSKDTIASTVIS